MDSQQKWLQRRSDEVARQFPERVALRFEGESMSYGELAVRSNQLARSLRSFGVERESAVGVCLERSMDLVVALLAVQKVGAAYVPLAPDYPTQRVAKIANDAEISAVIGSARASALRSLDVPVVNPVASEHDGSPIEDELYPAQLAYIIFTSGSTGRPKGAMLTHEALHNRLAWMQETFPLDDGDVVVQKTPFTFDVSVWEFFWPLSVGARLVIAKPGGHQEPEYLASLARDEGITTMHFVPSMLPAFLNTPASSSLPSLKRVICSGEALVPSLRDQFFERCRDAELHNLYGPTEATVDVSWWHCRRDSPESTIPIGHAIANTELYVLDDSGSKVPNGADGELYIGGVQLARGYRGRPALSAERFVPNPYAEPGAKMYRTGDRVRQREDGALEFLGRVDYQVKLRGFRIELPEIEFVLAEACAELELVAVVLRQSDAGDARLVAFYTAQAPVDGESLRRRLVERLPEYMIPSAFVQLSSMPMSGSGKIDRNALPTPDWSALAVRREFAPPSTPAEIALARIWSSLLGVERIGVDDRFFELGGHSIMATQVVTRIIDEFEVSLPVRVFLESPSLGKAATALQSALDDPTTPRLQRRQGYPARGDSSTAPLSTAQETIWVHEQVLRHLQGQNNGYIECPALRIRGPLQMRLLERAVNELAIRHESWRTCFVEDEEPAQSIAATMRIPLRLRNASCENEAQARQAMFDAASAMAARPFELEKTPLVRCTLVRFEDDDHALVFLMHHLITDAWSERLIARELLTLYETLRAGDPLPPSQDGGAQYGDFAAWQRTEAAKRRPETEDFWRQRFSLSWSELALPGRDGQDGGDERVCTEISAPDATVLREVAKQGNVSLSSLLYASFAKALAPFAQGEAFVLGVGNANRDSRNQDIPGCFAGVMPLAIPVGGTKGESVVTTAAEMARAVADGVPHTAMALPEISRLAGTKRGQAFLQVQVSTQLQQEPLQGPTLSFEPEYLLMNDAKFELELVITELANGCIELLWLPDPKRLPPGCAKRVADDFRAVIDGLG